MTSQNISIADYSYQLPEEKIAHHPFTIRHASKLLMSKNGNFSEHHFIDLPQLLPPESLLVLNNTRVIEARLQFKKNTGGAIEIFCLEPHKQSMELALQQIAQVEWTCLVGGASKWKPGLVLQKELTVNGKSIVLKATYQAKLTDGFLIKFSWNEDLSFATILHAAGAIPLPPYIKRSAEDDDAERYQTVFAKEEGSVAAPTAALHFTEEVFNALVTKKIDTAYITLNVGAGTFKPVKASIMADHFMHGEDFTVHLSELEKIVQSNMIVAVGTTSLRTLESLHWLGVKLLTGKLENEWKLEQWEAYSLDQSITSTQSLKAIIIWMNQHSKTRIDCRTSLLIMPGYRFKIPSALVTNFHQPQSTLLLLVAAFVGDDWRRIYQHALDNDYRFLSYGDSSLLWRKDEE